MEKDLSQSGDKIVLSENVITIFMSFLPFISIIFVVFWCICDYCHFAWRYLQ